MDPSTLLVNDMVIKVFSTCE